MDRASLRHLCDLCALELSPEEEDGLLRDLQAIANEFDVLSELPPVRDVESTQRVFFRDDNPRITPFEEIQVLIQNFPKHKESYLMVPSLHETEATSDT